MYTIDFENILRVNRDKNPRYVAYVYLTGAGSCAEAWARDKNGVPYIHWIDRVINETRDRLNIDWRVPVSVYSIDVNKAVGTMLSLPKEV